MRVPALNGNRAHSASLIALGAFAVHQLRYLLAYGTSTSNELAGPGHGYLSHAAPLLLGFALAILTARLVRGAIGRRRPATKRRITAASYALGIAAVFCCQELIEGALFAGHVDGLAAIFSAAGWSALPLAAIFGLLSALIDRGIEAIESLVASKRRTAERAPLRLRLPTPRDRLGHRLSPLALGLAQRPPPPIP